MTQAKTQTLDEILAAKAGNEKEEDNGTDSGFLTAIKDAKKRTGKSVYYIGNFPYAFHSPTNVRERLKPNEQGIYEPKDDEEIALLDHQVSKGLINKLDWIQNNEEKKGIV